MYYLKISVKTIVFLNIKKIELKLRILLENCIFALSIDSNPPHPLVGIKKQCFWKWSLFKKSVFSTLEFQP
jgi:hypothetical protein